MKRNIITIDENKCIGCGLCASACHQGAIGLVDGKAKLLHEDYCDGLGRCLPVCPTEAIRFEEQEIETVTVPSDIENKQPDTLACGCPGTNAKAIKREHTPEKIQVKTSANESHLSQWPVQIKLVPPNAPYFNNARLLIAADCAAYAYGNFHNEYMKNRITIIGCPKLDDGDYAEKLTTILQQNDIKSVTIVRMEVPCCSGIEHAAKTALQNCGKMIPWQVVTISTDGKTIEN
ncbi:MAG: 4Fe-4S binding protein [Lachnospiraceae bacterium]|nr:4Fe-4S binding protein [Lachnospiraceae bacterium]